VFAGQPFAITAEANAASPWSLGPMAFPWLDVDEQVGGATNASVGDLDRNSGLSAAQGRPVRHGPIKARHLDQTGDEADGLAQRQPEQDRSHVRQVWIA